jgi:hypothetical protein
MNWFHRAVKLTLLISALSTWFLAPSASAQTQTPTKTTSPEPKDLDSDEGWHVAITPYIWFAGVHGTVGALDHEASVHASFGDIFNYLNIGAMATVEPRYNRIVMPFDFLWMKLSDQNALPFDEGATSVKAKMTETLITQKIGYRFVDAKKVKVDALFGFRYWHLGTSLTLQPTQMVNGFSQSANWVDGLGGGRIELGLTPKLSAVVMGDAGGGLREIGLPGCRPAGLLTQPQARFGAGISLSRGGLSPQWQCGFHLRRGHARRSWRFDHQAQVIAAYPLTHAAHKSESTIDLAPRAPIWASGIPTDC